MGFQVNFNQTGFIFDRFGVITGTVAKTQFPDIPCSIFRLKGYSDNIGSFFIGNKFNTGSNALPWQIAPDDDTGWCVATAEMNFNLNALYHQNLSGTVDLLAYWIQK